MPIKEAKSHCFYSGFFCLGKNEIEHEQLREVDGKGTLRALTPVAPTQTSQPMETTGQAPTIVPGLTGVAEQFPTAAPAPPEVVQELLTAWPTEAPPVIPTNAPIVPTLAPTNSPIPPTLAPTNIPRKLRWTPIPPTLVPTNIPRKLRWTPAPAPTQVPLSPVVLTLVAPELVEENPQEVTGSGGMAMLQGQIDFVDESSLTLILTDREYYGSVTTGDGNYSFENVPNGTYNLSVAGQSGCGQIEVSVPEGVATLTYNYRFMRMQCTLVP